MKINLNTDEMKKYSGEIKNTASDLERNMHNIETLVLSLQSDWQGSSGLIFSNKILILKNQFSYLMEFVNNQADVINLIADDFEKADADIKAKEAN